MNIKDVGDINWAVEWHWNDPICFTWTTHSIWKLSFQKLEHIRSTMWISTLQMQKAILMPMCMAKIEMRKSHLYTEIDEKSFCTVDKDISVTSNIDMRRTRLKNLLQLCNINIFFDIFTLSTFASLNCQTKCSALFEMCFAVAVG